MQPAQTKVMQYYYHQRVQAGECLIIMNREVTCSSNMSMSFNYGKEKKKKKEDTFIGYLMQMKYLSESTGVDFSGQRKKQAVEIINGLYLLDVENRSRVEQEILQAELKNTFLTFMDVSKKGRGFTSLVFGMGQLSEEGIAKKIAEQISAIAFTMPHKFHMDREFAVLQKAALEAFRQQYPEREHFLMK